MAVSTWARPPCATLRSLTLFTAPTMGKIMAARIAMIAMTTRSSMRVKAWRNDGGARVDGKDGRDGGDEKAGGSAEDGSKPTRGGAYAPHPPSLVGAVADCRLRAKGFGFLSDLVIWVSD